MRGLGAAAGPARVMAVGQPQWVFERVLFEHGEEEAATGDVLQAIGQTRRTLTAELAAEFERDILDYAQV
jgi:hypothetical protein